MNYMYDNQKLRIMKCTTRQNKMLHFLLNRLGIDDGTRHDMMFNFTGGRTTSSTELTKEECSILIEKLLSILDNDGKKQDRLLKDLKQKSRRTIFKLMYDCGFLDAGMNNAEKLTVINKWIANKTKFDGKLNDLNYKQLDSIIRQLQAIRRNYSESYSKQAMYN